MAAAIGGSAAIGAGSSIFSGIMGSKGAKAQAREIRYSADKAAETALTLDNRARKDVAPFRDYGVKAGDTLMKFLTGDKELDDILKESSLFKFESELGSRNINRELSARGLYGSGAGLETLARFNNQLVAEEGSRYFDKLFNVASLGANASSHMASNTSATGRSVSNMQAQTGMAAAGAEGDAYRSIGSIGTGVGGAVAGGVNSYAQYQMYKPIIDRFGANRTTMPSDDDDFNAYG
jgi:hypothetical protein